MCLGGRVYYRDGKCLNTEFLKGDWILVTKTLEYGRQAVAAKQLSSFIYLETDESNGVKARFSKITFSQNKWIYHRVCIALTANVRA